MALDGLRGGGGDCNSAGEDFHIWDSRRILRYRVDKDSKGHLPGSTLLPSSLFRFFLFFKTLDTNGADSRGASG